MKNFNFNPGTIIEIPNHINVKNVFRFLSKIGYECVSDEGHTDKLIYVDGDGVFSSCKNSELHFEKLKKCGCPNPRPQIQTFSELLENAMGLTTLQMKLNVVDLRKIHVDLKQQLFKMLDLVFICDNKHNYTIGQGEAIRFIPGDEWNHISYKPCLIITESLEYILPGQQLLEKLGLIPHTTKIVDVDNNEIRKQDLYNTCFDFDEDEFDLLKRTISRASELGFEVGHLQNISPKSDMIYRVYFNSTGKLGYSTSKEPLFSSHSHKNIGIYQLFTEDEIAEICGATITRDSPIEERTLTLVGKKYVRIRPPKPELPTISEPKFSSEELDAKEDSQMNENFDPREHCEENDSLETTFMGFKIPTYKGFRLIVCDNYTPDQLFEKYIDLALDKVKSDAKDEELQDLFYPVSEYQNYLRKWMKDRKTSTNKTGEFLVFLGQFEINLRNYIKMYVGFDKIDEKAGFALISSEFILGAKSFKEYMDNLQQLIILHNEIKKVYTHE